MDKNQIVDTIEYYIEQTLEFARRGKAVDPISIIEMLRIIEKQVRELD